MYLKLLTAKPLFSTHLSKKLFPYETSPQKKEPPLWLAPTFLPSISASGDRDVVDDADEEVDEVDVEIIGAIDRHIIL